MKENCGILLNLFLTIRVTLLFLIIIHIIRFQEELVWNLLLPGFIASLNVMRIYS